MHRAVVPRYLHPFAWWGYALALVAASSLTTNPLLLGGIILAVSVVTLSSRGTARGAGTSACTSGSVCS